jgi:hypothetical protein
VQQLVLAQEGAPQRQAQQRHLLATQALLLQPCVGEEQPLVWLPSNQMSQNFGSEKSLRPTTCSGVSRHQHLPL